MARLHPLPFFVLLVASSASAQYDTLWVGTPDGVSTGLNNTPFPTGPGRTARTQYLVRSQDLVQAGLEPNTPIAGICVQVVDDDPTDPACVVNLHVRMKNTTSTSLNDFEYTGIQATGTVSDITLYNEVLGMPFDISPFQWIGSGNNLLVEINYERNVEAGISPRIVLDMDLGYTATFTANTINAMAGQDVSSTTPGVLTGSDNSLPVLGLLVEGTSGIHDRTAAEPIRSFPNPASQVMDVRLPLAAEHIRVTDMFGTIVLETRPTQPLSSLAIAGLPAGCYMLHALAAGSVIASGRFIKE